MKHAAIAASRQCNTQASRDQCSHYSAKKKGCICTYTAPRGWDALGINRVSTLIRTGSVRGGGVTGSQAFSTWARPGGKNNNGIVTVVLWFLCQSMGIYQNLYWIWIKLCFCRLLTQRCARRSCIAQKHWRGHFSFESPAHPQIKCNTGASHCADIWFYIV